MGKHEKLARKFSALPTEWQSWLEENLKRGCPPLDLVNILQREGLIQLEPDDLADTPAASRPEQLSDPTVTDEQKQSVRILNHQQQKWLAQAVLDGSDLTDIYQSLQQQGCTESTIAQALTRLHQHPYFQIAREQHFLVRKRNWLLNTLDRFARLNPAYLQVHRIPCPSFGQFIRHYYSRNLPVIFTDSVSHWPALKTWSPQYFKDTVGSQQIEVQCNREQDPMFERNSIQHKTRMQMNEFVELVEQAQHSNNFYMTANNAKASQSSLAVLFNDLDHFHGYTDHSQRDDRSFIWFGPKGTFTPLHHDLTNNILVQIYGRKKVTLIPALQVPYLYNDVAMFSQVADPHQTDLTASFPDFAQSSKIECILEPGEALFIPLGWWHCVESLDISISVSFTHFKIDNGGAEFFPSSSHC